MGRELKKVPLDFIWPIDQLWKGFINPFHSMPCKSCDQTGYNPATKRISDGWYSFETVRWVNLPKGKRYNDLAWQNHINQSEVNALVESGRLMDFTHSWEAGKGWIEKEPKYIPTADEVNEWNKKGFGHDAINRSICVKQRAEDLGVYGHCQYCNGEGELWQSDEIKKLHEEWVDFEPPTGDGYQLWSTTTEGHPMTPVFKSLDELCQYCEDNGTSVFGDSTATKEQWYKMLDAGFVSHQDGNMIFI